MSLPGSEAIQTRLMLLCRGPLDWTRASDGDPPLAPEGVRDIELSAAVLPRFDVIAASPQRSTQETVETVIAQRPAVVVWREGLDEIRTTGVLGNAAAYDEWLDRLFVTYAASDEGESLADGVGRLTAELQAIADRCYGRSALIVSHPVILLAFRGSVLQTAVQRDQVDTLPAPALSIIDYVEGRFYMVEDFPTRQPV
jgi:broad specificity phosphatase PhoE